MNWLEVLKTQSKKSVEESTKGIEKHNVQYSPLVVRLVQKGMTLSDAVQVEFRLNARSAEHDDRTLCYECLNLRGDNTYWRCAKPVQAGISVHKENDSIG
jgi:hypothetical protein